MVIFRGRLEIYYFQEKYFTLGRDYRLRFVEAHNEDEAGMLNEG